MRTNIQKDVSVQKVAQKKVSVKSIRPIGKQDVYNMEVAKHHNFSVNGGYIVHNCIDATRYALSEDMKQANISILR